MIKIKSTDGINYLLENNANLIIENWENDHFICNDKKYYPVFNDFHNHKEPNVIGFECSYQLAKTESIYNY